MALHSKDDVREDLLDDIYASADLSVSMPKYKFPENEHAPRHAYSVVHYELMLDGNSRQNLATFCQTWAEPEVHRPGRSPKTQIPRGEGLDLILITRFGEWCGLFLGRLFAAGGGAVRG